MQGPLVDLPAVSALPLLTEGKEGERGAHTPQDALPDTGTTLRTAAPFNGACGERGGKGDGWPVPELPWEQPTLGGGHLPCEPAGTAKASLRSSST